MIGIIVLSINKNQKLIVTIIVCYNHLEQKLSHKLLKRKKLQVKYVIEQW